jgi:hypothetical protein
MNSATLQRFIRDDPEPQSNHQETGKQVLNEISRLQDQIAGQEMTIECLSKQSFHFRDERLAADWACA